MTQDRALVRNASDPDQVKEGQRREQTRRDQELSDLRDVLAGNADGPTARRFIWRILRTANPGVQFSENARYQDFLLGNANVATWLEAEIEQVGPELYDLMRQEARQQTRG